MDALAMPWVNPRAAHLLAVHRMMRMEVGDDQEEKFDTNDSDLLMYTQKAETLEPFSSHIIPVKQGRLIWENALMLWYRPYRLRMAPCLLALQYRTCILS